MDTSPKKVPHDLETLMKAPKHQLEIWSIPSALPNPTDVEKEIQFSQAMFDDKAFSSIQREANAPAPTRSNWFVKWLWLPSLGAVAALFFIFLTPNNQNLIDLLRSKGRNTKLLSKDVSLQIGLWLGEKTKPKRLAEGDQVQSGKKLSIGFTIKKKSGYVALFFKKKNAPLRQIFPFEKKAVLYSPGFYLLSYKKQLRLYQLEKNSGNVLFILMKTTKPLPPTRSKWLQQQKKPIDALSDLRKKKPGIYFDSFQLTVKDTK